MNTRQKPKLSIIIPTKNEAKLLPLCLSSLQQQKTDVDFEIIIVDTNSTDGTQKIARSYGARVLSFPKKGKVFAFRFGADNARGDILCFTEADCVLPDTWVKTIAVYFHNNPTVGAICGLYTFKNAGLLSKVGTYIAHNIGHALYHLMFGHHAVRASNFAVRKSIYKRAGGFSEKLMELYDVEIAQRLSKFGAIHVLPELTIQTSDRRIRGRFFAYIAELIPALLALVQRKPITKQTYKEIR